MLICRVSLDNSDKLISLKSDKVDALPILLMLSEFTIINAEEQLPKHICEKCTNDLDIAYAFKRRYEDSIVKFMRQTTFQNEMSSKAAENDCDLLCKMYSEPAAEEEEPLRIRIGDIQQLSYSLVHDSNNDQEIDIEEMDTKPLSRSTPLNERPLTEPLNSDGNINQTPPFNDLPLAESLNPDEISNQILEEIEDKLWYHSNLNEHTNESRSIGRDWNSGVIVVDEHGAVFDSNSDENGVPQDREMKVVPYPAPATSPAETFYPDQRIDETTNELAGCSSGVPKLSQLPMTNFFASQSAAASNPELKEQNNFRILRSGSHRINFQGCLSRDILSKIYRQHGRGPKPFRCDICLRWFKTKGHIKTHRIRHVVRGKTIKCKECLSTFLTKPHFSSHKCGN